ncbi:BadF/BadG/BcrA/BcrD ATPase family protein [Thalassotalea sp. Y01]|uniref:N-acetylglucosamine kinase n=1 Tax=Thalassotalea sp. Y01 TaxID=2729613 RepID=UPI00145FCA00|nr:BadF/BadG/BcrA/BcrD ATPase family protein [Thalassotalea sp. Y01]NMP17792.1 ATPase [Thalassotalea sp. Y01]
MDSKNQQLYLGIDGGGSKCKAVIMNTDMQILGEGIAGAANPFHNLERAQQSIIDACVLALSDAGLERSAMHTLIAGVGLAGVNLPKYFQLMQEWQHPFKQMHLATDLHIACLGAHGEAKGAIMINGTGSVGYVTSGVESLVIGGHGFPHGDICSGAWLGFRAVEQVLLSDDKLVEDTLLTDKLFKKLAVKDANTLIEAIAGQGATFYGQFAIDVFDCAEAGDAIALQIIEQGAAYFCQVFNRLIAFQQGKVALIGGIKTRLMPYLPSRIHEQVIEPVNPPEYGAVLFAIKQVNS